MREVANGSSPSRAGDLKPGDAEMVETLYRLASSGRICKTEALLEEAKQLYPGEPESRIRSCMGQLGAILRLADF